MDVNMISPSKSSNNSQSSEDESDLRRGPWTVDEDLSLINYIATHGEGRWNSLARLAGLKRTGKSCRLRWLNYLRPDVRRGNITLEEQLLILELHSRWGNRWSKIAQYLPGRTDNEIKNYWRTRVQKHAKQLKCDVNSKQFKDTMRYLWMPRLVERIQAANAAHPTATATSSGGSSITTTNTTSEQAVGSNDTLLHAPVNSNFTPENSANSSDSFCTQVSDFGDFYGIPINNQDYFKCDKVNYGGENLLTSANCGYINNHAMNYQGVDNNNNNNYMEQSSQQQWPYGVGDTTTDNFWNVEDIYMLQQQFNM